MTMPFSKLFKWSVFPTKLRHWILHAGLGAVPSFCLGLMATSGKPMGIFAMLVGVVTIILGYALITSTSWFLQKEEGRWGRAFALAIKIRLWVSVLGIVGLVGFLLPPLPFLLFPDMMAGMVSLALVDGLLGGGGRGIEAGVNGFVPTLLTVWLEAAIVTSALLMLSLVITCWIDDQHNPSASSPREEA